MLTASQAIDAVKFLRHGLGLGRRKTQRGVGVRAIDMSRRSKGGQQPQTTSSEDDPELIVRRASV